MTTSKNITITVDAAQYGDHDDCLAAAADAARREYDLLGYDLDARWADEDRETIALTLPRKAVVTYLLHGVADRVGDDGTGDLGVIVRQALSDDPDVTVDEIVSIVLDARVEHAANAVVRCVSDRYDADGRVPYDSVEDFLAMCLAVHGERPELREVGGEWHDAEGVVLVPA